MYLGFYELSHEEFPFYSQQFVYDSLVALKDDMYPLVISYTLWHSYFSDVTFLNMYLAFLGFGPEDSETLKTDSNYGFLSVATLKMWVVAALEFNSTNNWDDGAIAILTNYFQISNVQQIIALDGFLWEAIEAVLTDMQGRYGSTDPTELAYYQWATLGISTNLPFNLGSVSPPIYQGFNRSFDFALEIAEVLSVLGVNETYLSLAPTLLEPQVTYPMTNTASLLSAQNMGILFNSYLAGDNETIREQFLLQSDSQIYPILAYLEQSGNFSITMPNGSELYDGYSLALSRLVRKSLVNETVSLRYDVYYGAMARALFCKYQSSETNCGEVVGQVNASVAQRVCINEEIGWDVMNNGSWYNLQVWLEAALKTSSSNAFQALLNTQLLSYTDLSIILYSGPAAMKVLAQTVSSEFKQRYACTKAVCTYDELFELQLGSSGVTNNLNPELAECGISNTTTLMDWFPDRYRTPIEFYNVTKIPMPPFLVANYFNYNAFLNPTALKLFFNFYFSQNFAAEIAQFAFPNNEIIYLFYEYFTKVLPGFDLIMSITIEEVVYGSLNPFLDFLAHMTIYEGGSPSTNPYYKLATEVNDTAIDAKHVMYSGKNTSTLTRTYYSFYGHHNMDMYWPGYDSNSPTASSWFYSDIWNGYNPINGSDGGQFGTRISDDDRPYVFISSLLRWFELSRIGSDQYHGLDLGHFVMSPWQLKNSASVPQNAAFWQLPNVLPGFMNISSQLGAPIFINLPHCYLCDESGMNMIEYYGYSTDPESYMSERITPHQTSDQPYAAIEQLSGAGVQIVLTFQVNVGLLKDYYFPDFYEEYPGAPLYFPFYILKRSANYTYDQVQDNFGSLMLAQKLKVIIFYVGIIVGSVFIILGIGLAVWYYRKVKKRDTAKPDPAQVESESVSDVSEVTEKSQVFLNKS